MNWLEEWAVNRALARMEGTMNQNWKGRVGAFGTALAAVAALCVAFANGTLTVEQAIAAAGAISAALSLFGIRQAIGKVGP